MNFRDIEAGNICILNRHGEQSRCVYTNESSLVDVYTGWVECDNVKYEFDEDGDSYGYTDVCIESIYANLQAYLIGSKSIWTKPEISKIRVGMQVKIKKGLVAGAVYGCMKCSPVAEHYIDYLVTVKSIQNGMILVAYKDCRPFYVTIEMLNLGKVDENKPLSEVVVTNPFMKQKSDYSF